MPVVVKPITKILKLSQNKSLAKAAIKQDKALKNNITMCAFFIPILSAKIPLPILPKTAPIPKKAQDEPASRVENFKSLTR